MIRLFFLLLPVLAEDPFGTLTRPVEELSRDVVGELQSGSGVSEGCRRDVRLMLDAARRGESWGMKYLDSMGKAASGVMESGLDFPGFASECLGIDLQGLPKGNYCFVQFVFAQNYSANSTWRLYPRMGLGICIPDSCSKEDLREASQTATIPHHSTSISISECVRPISAVPAESEFWIIIGIVMCFVLLAAIGTVYDLARRCPVACSTNSVACNNASSEALCQSGPKMPVAELLRAFSVVRSSRRITSLGPGAGPFGALHGLRFLTMACIVAGHSLSFAKLWIIFRNPNSMFGSENDVLFRIIGNATFTVDTFFFLSGFLAALSLLKEQERSGGKLRIFGAYIHRYIRMTPSMMIIIGLCATILRHLGSGPRWAEASRMYDPWCRENWWINALYVQNFYRREHMCLSHSWYSAVDMQFFILAPFITYICNKGKTAAVLAFMIPLSITTICPLALTIVKNLPASPTENVPPSLLDEYYAMLYIKPYCRMGPYIVGMALAYLITRYKKPIKMSKVRVGTGCLMVIFLNVAMIATVVIGRRNTVLQAAIYNGFARSCWAVLVAWLTFICYSGNAASLNKLMSRPVLVVLSRLTYNAYLVHPVLMALFYGNREGVYTYSLYSMVYLFLGNLCLTYLAAYVLSLLFETPIAALESAVRQRLTS